MMIRTVAASVFIFGTSACMGPKHGRESAPMDDMPAEVSPMSNGTGGSTTGMVTPVVDAGIGTGSGSPAPGLGAGGSGGRGGALGSTGGSGGTVTVSARDASVGEDARPPVAASQGMGALFGFENAAPDWTAGDLPLTRDTTRMTEGAASLMFVARAQHRISSRAFDTAELPKLTNKLSIDIYLTSPEGFIDLTIECQAAKLGGTSLGQKPFKGRALETWSPVVFDLPDRVVTALAMKANGCRMWFEHNGLGVVRYDRLAFIP